mmetsp:Transcript_49893/g.95340  ORF Transcript_49893/g.95340 Transcript_49893/m.95340 type:complete len:301 (-) Transcript_49893:130-1032(-)
MSVNRCWGLAKQPIHHLCRQSGVFEHPLVVASSGLALQHPNAAARGVTRALAKGCLHQLLQACSPHRALLKGGAGLAELQQLRHRDKTYSDKWQQRLQRVIHLAVQVGARTATASWKRICNSAAVPFLFFIILLASPGTFRLVVEFAITIVVNLVLLRTLRIVPACTCQAARLLFAVGGSFGGGGRLRLGLRRGGCGMQGLADTLVVEQRLQHVQLPFHHQVVALDQQRQGVVELRGGRRTSQRVRPLKLGGAHDVPERARDVVEEQAVAGVHLQSHLQPQPRPWARLRQLAGLQEEGVT